MEYQEVIKPEGPSRSSSSNEVQMDKIQLLRANIAQLEEKAVDAYLDKDFEELKRIGNIIQINQLMIKQLEEAEAKNDKKNS